MELKKVLQSRSIEHKTHRLSSRALAHLDELLDEALEQTFPASDDVAIDFERESHDTEARVLDSRTPLATGKRVRGPHRNTNAYPPALERVLSAEMRNKLTVELTHAATFGPTSRLFKV
jgi:hypothetical protein